MRLGDCPYIFYAGVSHISVMFLFEVNFTNAQYPSILFSEVTAKLGNREFLAKCRPMDWVMAPYMGDDYYRALVLNAPLRTKGT